MLFFYSGPNSFINDRSVNLLFPNSFCPALLAWVSLPGPPWETYRVPPHVGGGWVQHVHASGGWETCQRALGLLRILISIYKLGHSTFWAFEVMDDNTGQNPNPGITSWQVPSNFDFAEISALKMPIEFSQSSVKVLMLNQLHMWMKKFF